MITTDLTPTIKNIYQEFNNGNLEPLFELIHPEKVTYIYHGEADNPFTGTYKKMEGVMHFFSHLSEVEIERFDAISFINQGDKYLVMNDVKINFNETGKILEGKETHVLRFEDDILVEMNLYPPTVK